MGPLEGTHEKIGYTSHVFEAFEGKDVRHLIACIPQEYIQYVLWKESNK